MDMDIYNCRLKLYGGGCDVSGGMKYIYMFACGLQFSLACVCVGVFSFFLGARQSQHRVAIVF